MLSCPACGAKYKAPQRTQGKRIACPTCQHRFTASPEEQAAPVATKEQAAPVVAATQVAPMSEPDPFDEMLTDIPPGPRLPPRPKIRPSAPARPPRRRKSGGSRAGKAYLNAFGAIIVGGIVMLIGIGFTVFSYQSAEPGGSCTVYWGMVVVGLLSLGKGIVGLANATAIGLSGE